VSLQRNMDQFIPFSWAIFLQWSSTTMKLSSKAWNDKEQRLQVL
jgi:hypothetical protein